MSYSDSVDRSVAEARHLDPLRLLRSEGQIYSQTCEDGIIADIFSRIGIQSRTFVEIGIGDGTENTTRFLLEQGWSGVWVEGSEEQAASARRIFARFIEAGTLKVVSHLVTTETINPLLDEAGCPAVTDFMSVDIDMNTTHVWRSITRRSRVCCIEYNSSLPASQDIEVEYAADASWDGTNWFGGSLKTVERIGRSRAMSLVGCDPAGVNAFLVAEAEAAGLFREPFTAENHYQPPRLDLTWRNPERRHPPSRQPRRWTSNG